jgi:hypothetical protein
LFVNFWLKKIGIWRHIELRTPLRVIRMFHFFLFYFKKDEDWWFFWWLEATPTPVPYPLPAYTSNELMNEWCEFCCCFSFSFFLSGQP